MHNPKNMCLNRIHGPDRNICVVPSLCPQNRCQARLFDLVTKPYYEMVMVAVICLNVLCLAVETYDDSAEKYMALQWLNFVFILIFILEFVVKVIALRKHYFQDYWNVTDFIIVVLSVVGKFFACFTSPSCFYISQRISIIIFVV